MRNKVEIRAFAVEQVVRMRCMSDCSSEEIIREAKGLEEYIVGGADIPELVSETADMVKMFEEYKDALIQLAQERYSPPSYHDIVGRCLKPNEA